MKMFCSTDRKGMVSLARACAFFGITGVKDDMDGSMVYDQYLAGNGQGILDYCMRDVDNLRKLYLKLTYGEVDASGIRNV
jgi:predicted PolB exonuclease-like 3'-5' exonuclease